MQIVVDLRDQPPIHPHHDPNTTFGLGWSDEPGVVMLSMIGEVPNLTEEIYGSLLQMILAFRPSASTLTAAAPTTTGGWRFVEMWDFEEDGQRWFDENVKPNLPPDIVPVRTYYPLHSALGRAVLTESGRGDGARTNRG